MQYQYTADKKLKECCPTCKMIDRAYCSNAYHLFPELVKSLDYHGTRTFTVGQIIDGSEVREQEQYRAHLESEVFEDCQRPIEHYKEWPMFYETRTALVDAEQPEKNVKDRETEIRTQVHLMDAEGTCDNRPTIREINTYLRGKGFDGENFEIFYDDMQKTWRWNCDITRLTEAQSNALASPVQQEEYNPISCDHKKKSGRLEGFSAFELLSHSSGNGPDNGYENSISVCRECGTIKIYAKQLVKGKWEIFQHEFTIDYPDAIAAIVKQANWMNQEIEGYRPFVRVSTPPKQLIELKTPEQICQEFSLVDAYGKADETVLEALKAYKDQLSSNPLHLEHPTQDKELIRELTEALKGVVRVADRATVEFDRAKIALTKAEAVINR